LPPLLRAAGRHHAEYRTRAPVLRERALENEVQVSRPDPRVADVAHVDPTGAQGAEAVRRVEQALELPRPRRWLVEREALGRAPSRHQYPVEPLLIPAHITTALAV